MKYDFKAFGQAIKAARKAKGISRNQLADTLNIAPRYIASIENSGQHPSLQILYELVTLLDVSVDQFFFPKREQEKSTRRRQLDTMLDTMSETDLKIIIMLIPPIRDVLILLSFSGLLGISQFVTAPGQRDGTFSSLYSSRFYLSAHKRHACPPT